MTLEPEVTASFQTTRYCSSVLLLATGQKLVLYIFMKGNRVIWLVMVNGRTTAIIIIVDQK